MALSKVVGATSRKDGYMEGNGYIVSWCVGHLVGLAEPEEYGKQFAEKPWKVENLPIIPSEWKFSVNKDTKKQFEVLRTLMNSSKVCEVVNACDAGREGECIFRYVYHAAECDKPTKRLWVSSLEESAIREGMANLRSGSDFDNLYASGLCRAKADFLIGMNTTRAFSAVYRTFLSVGRVQTPTLAMIAERDFNIDNFVKAKFHAVNLDCGDFTATTERIDRLSEAERIKSACTGATATVKAVGKVKTAVNPPKLYDLTTLQREANRLYGFTAQQTLDYTQKLYESRLVSYPRTDSQFLTEDMADTASGIIRIAIAKIPLYTGLDYEPNIQRIIKNSAVTDHHGIIPTSEIVNVNIDGLPDGERKVLLMIVNKLLCATADKHEYEAVSAVIKCNGYYFAAKGKTVLNDGWKAIERLFKGKVSDGEDDSEKVLNITTEQIIENTACTIAEKYTSPPSRFNEDTLLKAMEIAGNKDYAEDSDVEKKGIGTPATRAATIETLIKRGYVERRKKNIVVTEKGANLIKIVPESVKSAKLTADWESALSMIAKGEFSADYFMEQIEKLTADIVSSAAANVNTDISVKLGSSDSVGKCPKCGGDVVANSKAYSCNKRCGFVIWKSIAKKAISESVAKQLLEKGRTSKVKGFKNKSGNDFEAVLMVMKDFSVGFDFSSGRG